MWSKNTGKMSRTPLHLRNRPQREGGYTLDPRKRKENGVEWHKGGDEINSAEAVPHLQKNNGGNARNSSTKRVLPVPVLHPRKRKENGVEWHKGGDGRNTAMPKYAPPFPTVVVSVANCEQL